MPDAGPSEGFFTRMYNQYVKKKKNEKSNGSPAKIDPAVTAAVQKKKGDFAAGSEALMQRRKMRDELLGKK